MLKNELGQAHTLLIWGDLNVVRWRERCIRSLRHNMKVNMRHGLECAHSVVLLYEKPIWIQSVT